MGVALLALLLSAVDLQPGLDAARAGDPSARAKLVAAFLHDPEAMLPAGLSPEVQQLADAARAEAIAALRARLDDAAVKAAGAFTTPLTVASSHDDPLPPVAPPPPEKVSKPTDDSKPRPLAFGGRLTVGGYGFYVIGENSGGVAPELGFGVNVGPVRLGGAASLMLGSSLAATLAFRITATSEKKVSFLGAGDLGVFYGGANAVFAPFATVHLGLRVRLGPVALEIRIASLSVFYVSGAVRFVPQAGIGLLL